MCVTVWVWAELSDECDVSRVGSYRALPISASSKWTRARGWGVSMGARARGSTWYTDTWPPRRRRPANNLTWRGHVHAGSAGKKSLRPPRSRVEHRRRCRAVQAVGVTGAPMHPGRGDSVGRGVQTHWEFATRRAWRYLAAPNPCVARLHGNILHSHMIPRIRRSRGGLRAPAMVK
jgi:hypothetical protein